MNIDLFIIYLYIYIFFFIFYHQICLAKFPCPLLSNRIKQQCFTLNLVKNTQRQYNVRMNSQLQRLTYFGRSLIMEQRQGYASENALTWICNKEMLTEIVTLFLRLSVLEPLIAMRIDSFCRKYKILSICGTSISINAKINN